MMSATSPPTRMPLSPLQAVFTACGVTLGWLVADLAYGFLVDPHRLRLLTTYLLPFFAVLVLVSVWRLGLTVVGTARPLELIAGVTFLVGAALIDLTVTVRSDPFLSLEGNPYIRVLLDVTEHSYGFVYALVALTQALFVSTFVAVWWSFLRHRRNITAKVNVANAESWPSFVKAATGGGHLSYRQWLFPFKPHEIPDPYMSVWPAALAACFGTSLFRYWAAAEWMRLVPTESWMRYAVLTVGVVGTLVVYYGWLAWKWSRSARQYGTL
jgi:hypothetical protein